MNKHVDYILVGQGIAGTILAYQLLRSNLKVKVIDQGFENSSSFVSGALINPIVLKRITKTWRADDFVKYNPAFYDTLNLFLGKKYYHKMAFEKLINSEDEKYFWTLRYSKEDLKNYISPELNPTENKNVLTKPFLSGFVKETAWLDIKPMLENFRSFLKKEDAISEINFDYNAIVFHDNGVEYKGIKAKKIIFCEGANIIHNPFFKNIPMSLNKGELITIKSEELQSESILVKSIFILPIGNNSYKVGSTFEWKWDDNKPTEEKKQWLIDQLKELTTAKFSIINHEAGIRPSTKDRRPALGFHSQHNNLVLFNGLGTRGCFTAPLLAEELILFLEKGIPLDKEINVNRFYD